jgi:A/G-specific adenine glycosylase
VAEARTEDELNKGEANKDGPAVAARLLAWYDRQARVLPWRTPPGAADPADPYRVWLSEIMLQQTTVKAVLPRYGAFLARWPDVASLAAAPLGEVLAEWAGLGYYARARNLHACARAVVEQHGGRFPDTESGLRSLPGVGAYTAAAVAAIAFGARATPVDGNIERVVARLFALRTPRPQAKPQIRRLAESLTPENRAGDFAQGLMDLGAGICTPARPLCGLCPLREDCSGLAAGIAEQLPCREDRGRRPVRRGVAFLALRADGAVLLRERAPKGLLGGMLEVPATPWAETKADAEPAPDALPGFMPFQADWQSLPGLVEHTFTHFHLELRVERVMLAGEALAAPPPRCLWLPQAELAGAALPSVMRKILAHGGVDQRPVKPARKRPGGIVPDRGGKSML